MKDEAVAKHIRSYMIQNFTSEKERGKILMAVCAKVDHKSLSDPAFSNYIKSAAKYTENDGDRPLHLAACKGKPKIVQFLLDNGADVNAKNFIEKRSPLLEVIWLGSCFGEVFKQLFAAGAEVNVHDRCTMSVLMCSVVRKKLDVCKVLLENGADVNTKNKLGQTALTLAIENGSLDIFNALLVSTTSKPTMVSLLGADLHAYKINKKIGNFNKIIRSKLAGMDLLNNIPSDLKEFAADFFLSAFTGKVSDISKLDQAQILKL